LAHDEQPDDTEQRGEQPQRHRLRPDRALGVDRLVRKQRGLHELAVRVLVQFPLHRGPVRAAVLQP